MKLILIVAVAVAVAAGARLMAVRASGIVLSGPFDHVAMPPDGEKEGGMKSGDAQGEADDGSDGQVAAAVAVTVTGAEVPRGRTSEEWHRGS